MKPEHREILNRSFEIQASGFESDAVNFTNEEYLSYTLSKVAPDKGNIMLEVAAGTCVCSRTFAPFVQTLVCLDATIPMLQIGKQEAEKHLLENMIFIKGYAEELPFLEGSFDIVLSRLAFHHFTQVHAAFSEMVRVLKPGGKLVLIDMEAADEELRKKEDEIETLRDPSHVRNLSRMEMLELFEAQGLFIELCEMREMPQRLESWLSLTQTPQAVRKKITEYMRKDMDGQKKTRFSPYIKGEDIFFNHRWILTIGKKSIGT